MAGLRCMKIFVVCLCVLIFMVGAAIFVAGLAFRLESGVMGSEVITLFNKIHKNRIYLGYILLAHAYGMIAMGGTIMIKSIFGMRAAVKEGKCGLKLFIGMTVFMILAQAAHVALWVNTRTMPGEWLQGEMLLLLKGYQGPTNTDAISDGWNNLFMEGHCCGVVDQFANGDSTSDFEDVESEWFKSQVGEKIPATCCMGTDDEDISSAPSDCTTTPKYYYTKGCQTKLSELINAYSLIYICSVGGLFVLQMLALFGTCTLKSTGDHRVFPGITKGLPSPFVRGDTIVKTKFNR